MGGIKAVMRQSIGFSSEFFKDEVREGFLIESKMKCAWAAQMEVLKEIDRICEKHGIRYFADSGTLLGAVRHKGFIPWDDDIDIAMLRDDYRKFFAIATEELPAEWKVLDLKGGFKEFFGRVTNSDTYDSRAERLLQFHGCPYVVGVDIFPIDYVPVAMEEEEVWYLLIKSIHGLLRNITVFGEENILEKIEPDLQKIEKICRVKLGRNGNLDEYLRKLLNEMMQIYAGEKVEELEYIVYDIGSENKRCKYKREWYAESKKIPFENIMVPVPVGYDGILRAIYGDDYMTPKREITHDYPFYKKQDMELEKIRVEKCKMDNGNRIHDKDGEKV